MKEKMKNKRLIKFEHFSKLYPYGLKENHLTKIVIQHIGQEPILDVGCGDGNLLISLKNKFECEGFDISEIAIKKAKEKGVKAKVSTIQNFKSRKKFGTIILLDVLPYLVNHERDFKKIVSWLDEGGRILVNLCNRYALRKILKINYKDEKNFPYYYPTYWEFKKLTKENGLKVVKSFGGGVFKHFPVFSLAIFYILEKRGVEDD